MTERTGTGLTESGQERRILKLDALTGLPGREALLERIDALESTARCGLLCIDIDQLAALNEAMGLSAGDRLLTEVGRRVATHCGASDLLVRFGGDEFALLVQEVDTPAQLELIATQLVETLHQPYLIAGRELFISTSIGAAYAHPLLLQHAEAALARAKVSARGNWLLYTDAMARSLGEHFHFETELRAAMEAEQFLVYYQPKASCRSGAITGFEALVRWNHPTRGIVPPSEFIPSLEKTGLIERVGAWVLRTACQQLKTWEAMGFATLQMAVNVSLRQLADPSFPELVAAVLSELELPASRLELELTESMLMHDVTKSEKILFRLKALGVSLSIDDFGTGYSSLAYLKRLPIDKLKIDRSFVQDITTDPNDASITRAIIGMAHSLKMTVIAEGVETEAQLATLVGEQCETVQGYFISKPMPAALATDKLTSGWVIPPFLLGRPTKERTLLLVDDEESILLALKRLLRREDYRVLCASSGLEGLELLAKNDVDVVVSDQRMPHMTGEEFLRRTKELYPQTIRIVLSGFADMQSITSAINQGAIYKFMSKPWEDKELKDGILEAFQRKEKQDAELRLVKNISVANRDLHQSNQSLVMMLDEQSHSAMISQAALQIAQENLYLLPVPVLGLDPDGLAVLGNEAYAKLALAFEDCAALAALVPPWPRNNSFSFAYTDQKGNCWRMLGRHLTSTARHRGTVLAFMNQEVLHG